jgi:hypothetical protein
MQYTSPHPTSTRSILTLSNHLRLGLPCGLLPSGFPTNNLYAFLFFPHSGYMPRPPHPPWLDYSNNTLRRVQTMKLFIMQFSPLSLTALETLRVMGICFTDSTLCAIVKELQEKKKDVKVKIWSLRFTAWTSFSNINTPDSPSHVWKFIKGFTPL